MFKIAGYEMGQILHESTKTIAFRAKRRADGRSVILKMLNDPHPTPEQVAWFRREYEVTRGLQLAEVVTAYELLRKPCWLMVLEDFGGESLARLGLLGQLTMAEFLELAIKITHGLGQLHQQHVIHKDINPSNLVWNPHSGILKLIDFGISTVLSKGVGGKSRQEKQAFANPNLLVGTLAYISPEQTGRMNRPIDYRTDYYSLGATFYHLLTGQLPFATTDPLELVHSHLAKSPLAPHELNPDIPPILSQIVLKLMAKSAEARYQSVIGLNSDLQRCLWEHRMKKAKIGSIAPFVLGEHDVSDKFHIPAKLYGREQEIEALSATFERVNAGAREMMLVAGYSGVGKSALVQELYKPLTQQRGFYLSGKFDQFQRNMPYSGILQAFRGLISQLLAENEAQIAAWREKLFAALGPNAQIIIDVMPEVELIVGSQPALPELGAAEQENRFHLVFERFIKVFTAIDHPLLIFLDDVQWADGASLKLIERLMSTPNHDYLLLIAAYRDNEVNDAHPLMLTLKKIKQMGTTVNQLTLLPLDLESVRELIADTLNRTPQEVEPLAQLVAKKTNGNPFFLSEFLKSLYTEGLITFDYAKGAWQWDLAQIEGRQITDNVVELMAGKVQRLSSETQEVLNFAACIGNHFDLQTLAVVYGKSLTLTAVDLWSAVVEGLILPLNDTYKILDIEVEGLLPRAEYKFAHDRVQQAVYSLISAPKKETYHWRIGQLLLTQLSPTEQERRIFDLVNQLNQGRTLIKTQHERDELAQLNLLSGQRAKATAAYEAAFDYLQVGLELLSPTGEEAWGRLYDLTLALHVEASEASYLSGSFTEMERLIGIVQQRARTRLDKIKVIEVQLQAYSAQNKLKEALQIGLEGLSHWDITFPNRWHKLYIVRGLASTKLTLVGKRIEDLIDLPQMNDVNKLVIMRIISSLGAIAFLTTPELVPLMAFKQVKLSVKYGNSVYSHYVYSIYGMILCGVVGEIERGYRFGQLALRLLGRLKTNDFKAKTYFMVYTFISHWKTHLRETLSPLREAYQSGLESGDLEYAAYAMQAYHAHSFGIGHNLLELEKEMDSFSKALLKLKQETSLNYNKIQQQFVLNLLGRNKNPCYLQGEVYDEEQMLPLHQKANDKYALFTLYYSEFVLCYLFEDYTGAQKHATECEPYLEGLIGLTYVPLFHFYDALTQLALYPDLSKSEQKQAMKKVRENQKKMKKWATHAPMNHQHRYALVEAEWARVLGKDAEAREYYDQAIEGARKNQYINEEALANKLAGRFYLAKGRDQIAQLYLRQAHLSYAEWGALAKVKQLEANYPHFFAQPKRHTPITVRLTSVMTSTQGSSSLDLISALKASQAISGEIVLETLLSKLISIVIENAGAQRGFLILEQKGRFLIEAAGELEGDEVTVLESLPIEEVSGHTDNPLLSNAIVHYVARTKESLVLHDATRTGAFTRHPYILRQQPKSILCTPLINQGKLIGMLYLENNLTTEAFTPDRLELLHLLCAQAAISIENAQLYNNIHALNKAYERFVPSQFLRLLGKESITDVQLGDQVQKEMTILFSDIRDFTAISEKMSPADNFEFVNNYLRRMEPIIIEHHGFIDKYMGDGIMALFPTHVEEAIRAAIAMLHKLRQLNLMLGKPIKIGIGLHTGLLMLGTVGGYDRMDGTVISDAVNLAARIESSTKQYGATLLISEECYTQLAEPSRYAIRQVDRVAVKGKIEPVTLYDLFDGDSVEQIRLKKETLADFELALTMYRQQEFAFAEKLFRQVLQHNPQDKAAKLYVERCKLYQQRDMPPEWDGVFVATTK